MELTFSASFRTSFRICHVTSIFETGDVIALKKVAQISEKITILILGKPTLLALSNS